MKLYVFVSFLVILLVFLLTFAKFAQIYCATDKKIDIVI